MLQYLIINNHLQAAKVYKQQSSLTWKQLLLSSFTKGQRESFFGIYELLRKEQKLEFYLRVYFLIYSIHPHINQSVKNNAISQKQINSFREFLDTKGADLAKTSEFLQFYALPFIKKPLQHATFKTLFTKNWLHNLKEKLVAYIQIEQESMGQVVKSLFQKQQSQLKSNKESIISSFGQQSKPSVYEQKLKTLQQTNNELFNQLQTIKQGYRHLQSNHQTMIEDFNQYMMESQNKWFQSYKELVKTAKTLLEIVGVLSGKDPKLQRKYIQGKRKIDKYEKFIGKKLEDLLSVSQDISLFDKPSMNEISQYTVKSGLTSKSWITNNIIDKNYSHTQNNNNITSYVQIDQYIATNFTKLNQDFAKMSDDDKNLVIQGFCWRLIKSKSMQIRRFYCIAMIKNNFLGMSNTIGKPQHKKLQLCKKHLKKSSYSITILQLLNYLKVDYFSRQHFFKHHNITYPIMQLIAQSLQQTDIQAFLIALDILSTVSAYKDYRESVFQAQLSIFLLNVLESYPKVFESEQLMELIMIILMNVSSFEEGLRTFQEYPNIYSTLSLAFEQDQHDIIMLVNGFFYTLLGNRKLYQLALQSNMPEFIKFLLSSQQHKEHQRQLKFIEARLQNFCGNQNTIQAKKNNYITKEYQAEEELYLIDGEQEDQEIQVVLEEELDNLEQYIKGHQLLSTKYALKQKETLQQEKQIKAFQDEFMNRNATINPKSANSKAAKPQSTESLSKFSLQKNIPQQSRLKKPPQIKNQEIQPSGNENHLPKKQPAVQSIKQEKTIKQQIFNSPPPKFESVIEQPIPPNTKQAQFMGLLSKQKNPTYAKLKTEVNQQYASPTIPISQNNNLPNFGSYSPPPQLGPEQKTRRKQILKQLNEEIQSKNKQKAQKKQKLKTPSDKRLFQDQITSQYKKNQPKFHQFEEAPKAARGNAHMKKEEIQKSIAPKQKVEERKAFESRPKLQRTPPKDDQVQN